MMTWGNHLPDFSFAGYEEGGMAIPTNVPVAETINPVNGDNTANIQDAINAVSALTPDVNGFRGAVLSNPGTYIIGGTLRLNANAWCCAAQGTNPKHRHGVTGDQHRANRADHLILLPCLKHANELKIPVVDLDGNLDPEITKKAGVEVAFHIGSDNEAAGAKGADYLVSALGKDAKGPVLVIEGLSGNITGAKRAHGFADELKKAAPGLAIVASLPGDWDSLKAANITNDTLQRNPDLVAIFCANDDMALGAVEAARAAGKDKLIVIGVDGNSNAVKSILAGRLNASVAQLPYLVGMQAVENAKKVLAGEKVPEFTYVPTLVLTKAALDAKSDPMLQYVK